MMFKAKQRPDGLVFPACDECNQGTSHSDLVASMLGRVYPDAADDADRADIQKTIQAVANNVPGPGVLSTRLSNPHTTFSRREF